MALDNVEDILYLSPMQHLMLMHCLRLRGSSTLINQFSYRIDGPVDADRLARAWQWATDRHQALRTAFVWEDVPQPVQVVRATVDVDFRHIDLRGIDPSAQHEQTEQIKGKDRDQGFDLRLAPLMRTTLITLEDQVHLLIWTRHHLILDLWSQEILFREVASGYDTGSRSALATGKFGDYISWLDRQDPGKTEAYWRRYLRGIDGPTLLFSGRAHRAEWSREGQAVWRSVLDSGLETRLIRFAGQQGITPNTLFQAALALAIATRTRNGDVLFGMTVSGRPVDLADVEQTAGSFINNVPTRTTVDPGRALGVWLSELQTGQVGRMAFEYCSPIDIHRWSGLPADRPLFDLLLLLNLRRPARTESGGLHMIPTDGPLDSALPMTLTVERPADRIELTAVFDKALISMATARTLVGDIIDHLARLSEAPDIPIADLLPADFGSERPIPARPIPVATLAGAEPAEGTEDILLDIWRRTLGIADIGVDEDFFALGGTSIQAAIAFSQIEDRLGLTLPLSTLFAAGSVRGLMEAIEAPTGPMPLLVDIQRKGTRPAVLAAFGIGGNVINLANLSRALGDRQPFFGLQSRGLDGQDAPLTRVEDIAADYIRESAAIWREPCVLLGVCFGANVMLEMAQQLAAKGFPPLLLVVMDPTYQQNPTENRADLIDRMPVLQLIRDRIGVYRKTLNSMSWRERPTWLIGKSGALLGKLRQGGLLRGNETELRNRRVQTANLAAASAYRPVPYRGELRVLITSDRPLNGLPDPRLDWVSRVAPEAPVAPIQGKDTGDAVGRFAPVLADRLARWIDEILEPPAPTVTTASHAGQALEGNDRLGHG